MLLVSIFASSSAVAEGWYAFTSDNFTLYSDAPEEDTKQLVEKFEIFRDTALLVLGLPDQPENQRLVIIVYSNPGDFGRIRPGDNVTGFYYDSIFGPRMLLRDAGGNAARETLFHEYVHYLMNQRSTYNYPPWYAEGLATLLMTADIDETIVVGKPPRQIALGIQLGYRASVHDVVTVAVDAEDGFYLTSWLLSHYFSLGNPTRRQQTLDYLRRYDAGEDPVEAFEASYGISTSGMERELAAYARRPILTALEAPKREYSGSLSTRALARSEALLLLADIAVEVDALEAAGHTTDVRWRTLPPN